MNMESPNKIYIPMEGRHLGDDWMYEPQRDCENEEYIRKESLLDWAVYKRDRNSFGTEEYMLFQQLIAKLNEI